MRFNLAFEVTVSCTNAYPTEGMTANPKGEYVALVCIWAWVQMEKT